MKECNEQNFFGVAIGGSLGDCKKTMYETVRLTMKFLKTKKPVHLLGIGGIQDIFNGVENGKDTFDCVHPTRIARHGCALIKPINNNGKEFIDISKGKYKNIHSVIDLNCSCPTCKNGDGYLLSYLNYLIKIGETVYGSIIMMHNVYFMNQLMEDIRFGIKNDLLEKVKFDYLGFK
jgi:queuine tRNA-ribosyltransferase